MEVIAAINLYNDRCIDTINLDYSVIQDCDPINIAKKWNNVGANWIHLADINGIKDNIPANIPLVKEIISKVNAPIQVASGINDIDAFEDMLASGAGRIVLDSRSLNNPDFITKVLDDYSDKTIMLFNVNSGSITENENYHGSLSDIVNNLKKQGLEKIIYHDISENFEFNYDDLIATGSSTGLPILACGKINGLSEIKKFKQIAECEGINLEGIILSRPLYNNTINLFDVIKLIEAYPYIGDFYSREDFC